MNAIQKPTRRTAMIAGAAGLALIGAVGVSTAALADGAPTPSSSAAATVAPPATGAPAAPGTVPTQGAPAGPATDAAAPTPPKHEPHIGGEVRSVSGSTITVTDGDGFTRSIALGDDVTVTKDGATSSVSAIVKGEHIDATGSVADDGTTLDATAVSVGMPTPPQGGPGDGPKGGPAAPPAGAPAAPSKDGSTTAPSTQAGGSDGNGGGQPADAPTTSAPAPTSGS